MSGRKKKHICGDAVLSNALPPCPPPQVHGSYWTGLWLPWSAVAGNGGIMRLFAGVTGAILRNVARLRSTGQKDLAAYGPLLLAGLISVKSSLLLRKETPRRGLLSLGM